MENTGIYFDRRRFDSVWQRVTPDCGAQKRAGSSSHAAAANTGAAAYPDMTYPAAAYSGMAGTQAAAANTAYQPAMCPKAADSAEAVELSAFLVDAAMDEAVFRCLMCMLRGCAGALMKKCAEDMRCCLNMLRAKYYLLTGESFNTQPYCPCVFSPADTLRSQYDRMLAAEAAYLDAAAGAARSDLRELYSCCAAIMARNARRCACAVEELMRRNGCGCGD